MEIIDGKRNKRTQFVVLYIITVALIALSFVAFLVPGTTANNKSSVGFSSSKEKLLDLYNVLHSKWLNYLSLKENSSSSPAAIANAKNEFKKSVDSVETIGKTYEISDEKQHFEQVITSFRKSLEVDDSTKVERSAEVNTNMSAANIKEEQLKQENTKNKQQLQELEKMVEFRDSRINELQDQVASSKSKDVKPSNKINTKTIQENEFLKWAIRSQVTDLKKLKDENASLKQANSKLNAQLSEIKK